MATKPGLYANINAKQDRIKAGSGEKMNKVGSKAAPSKQDCINSAKTAKKKKCHSKSHLRLRRSRPMSGPKSRLASR